MIASLQHLTRIKHTEQGLGQVINSSSHSIHTAMTIQITVHGGSKHEI